MARRRPAMMLLGSMLIGCMLLIPRGAWADGLSAAVDRTQASMEEQLTLTLTVDGSRSAEPTLPDLQAFDVRPRGHSTQVQIVNGHMSSKVSYSYGLFPKRPGTFTIGAATVEIDGKVYQSEPFSITITNAPANEVGSGPLFTTADVSNHTPYVGEQVIYTWRFFARARTTNLNLNLPSFDGFMAQNLGDKREYDSVVHGQQYHVIEIRKALFPQEVGRYPLPAATLQCDVFVTNRRTQDDFFGSPFDDLFERGQRQTRILRTAPAEIKVQALPPAPPGFTGLVGNFQMSAQLSQSNLQVGDSTTLTITINGNGSMQTVSEPAVELPGFKTYDDKPTSQINAQGSALLGTKVFRKALVATQAGDFILPPLQLSYFDPQTRTYKITSTNSFALHVTGGQAQDPKAPMAAVGMGLGSGGGKLDVQVLGEDILPIYKRLDALDDHRFRTSQAVGWGIVFTSPPLLFGILAWVEGRRRGGPERQALLRRRGALRAAMKASSQVQSLLKTGDIAQASALASRAVRQYLGNKFGVEGLALTPTDARSHLERRSVAAALAAETETWLSRCEAAQYGIAAGTQSMYVKLTDEMRALLTRLEKALRGLS